jgi:CubicO group peptidase (beta-lactamase class C family)
VTALGREGSEAISGRVAVGFEPVAEEFARNFDERGEVGASFAAMVGGTVVVDLWGGVADAREGRAWERDTLQVIFSGTKALVAVCLLMLVDKGQLSIDARVSDYWPEFADADKRDVLVSDVVSHRAKLPGLMERVTIDDLTDDRRMAQLLAEQPQFSDERASCVYHPLTYGWLCGELVRRIDGRSVGRFFADEIAGPLDLEVFIGLPDELASRVSHLELADNWNESGIFDETEDPLQRAVWANPPFLARDPFPWNQPAYHRAEIAGGGGIGTARSVAKLYASIDQLLSPAAIDLGVRELANRTDPLADEAQRFGFGFELQTEIKQFGPPLDAFGHTGAGGSCHGRWPAQNTGFSYAMNLMRDDCLDGDPRAGALLGALYDCLNQAA